METVHLIIDISGRKHLYQRTVILLRSSNCTIVLRLSKDNMVGNVTKCTNFFTNFIAYGK